MAKFKYKNCIISCPGVKTKHKANFNSLALGQSGRNNSKAELLNGNDGEFKK
jgi:hypothetical protein